MLTDAHDRRRAGGPARTRPRTRTRGQRAGKQDLLRQVFVHRAGHCAFTAGGDDRRRCRRCSSGSTPVAGTTPRSSRPRSTPPRLAQGDLDNSFFGVAVPPAFVDVPPCAISTTVRSGLADPLIESRRDGQVQGRSHTDPARRWRHPRRRSRGTSPPSSASKGMPKINAVIAGHAVPRLADADGRRHLLPGRAEVDPGGRRRRAGRLASPIELELDTAPRMVEPPADLAQAIGRDKKAAAAWETLSYTNKKEMARSPRGGEDAGNARAAARPAALEKLRRRV